MIIPHNIEKITIENKNYRKVIYTDENMQLVLMSIEVGEDIPLEIHSKTTQFIRVESGRGIAKTKDKDTRLSDGISIIIPSKTFHYIKTTGDKPLKLYTIYSPPEHLPNTINKRQP